MPGREVPLEGTRDGLTAKLRETLVTLMGGYALRTTDVMIPNVPDLC